MSKIFLLTKVFLKNGSDSLFKSKKKGFPKSIVFIILIAALVMSIGIPFGVFVEKGYDVLAQGGQQGIILGFALALVSAAIFIFGIFYVLTVFYFTKDIENLLPLPLKPSQILGAKFITVVIYEYFTEVVFLLPVLIAYGIKSQGGILYFLYALIIFLVLPVIPLIIASIINIIIMRFTNLGKHKDAFKVIGGLLAMFVGIGVNMYVQRSANSGANEDQIKALVMQGNNSLVGLVSKFFPSAKLASWSLIESSSVKGIENLLLFLVITAAFLVVFLLLGESLYFKGVLGVSESYSKRKKFSSSELDKATTQSSAIMSYTLKELKILFRTPAYLMNCVIVNFLWPVFMLIPIYSQRQSLDGLKQAGKFLEDPGVLGIVLAGGLAASLFISSSNGVASTSISREGQNLFVSKYLPMRYKHQLMAKVLSGVFLNMTGVLLMVIVASAVTQPPLYVVFLIIIIALLGVIFSSFTGIFIDLNAPKLDWDNEQKAVKQNFNLIINMFLCVIIAAGVVLLCIKLKLELWTAFSVIVVLFGAADMVLFNLLSTTGEKLFDRIKA